MKNNLLEIRKELGLSQEKMGEMLGCERVTYNRHERGQRGIPLECLVYLSIACHLSTDYILGLTGKETVPEITKTVETYLSDWKNDKPYCKRIRELRQEKGLTQGQAAEAIHCSQQTYSCYENGTRGIMAKVLVSLAQFYGVSTDYILGLKDER